MTAGKNRVWAVLLARPAIRLELDGGLRRLHRVGEPARDGLPEREPRQAAPREDSVTGVLGLASCRCERVAADRQVTPRELNAAPPVGQQCPRDRVQRQPGTHPAHGELGRLGRLVSADAAGCRGPGQGRQRGGELQLQGVLGAGPGDDLAGTRQALVARVQVAAHHGERGRRHGALGAGHADRHPGERDGESVRGPAREQPGEPALPDQDGGGGVPVTGDGEMPDRFDGAALAGHPLRRLAVEPAPADRGLLAQLGGEEVTDERVVAEGVLLPRNRLDEGTRLRQRAYGGPGLTHSGEVARELGRQVVDHARGEQEVTHRRRLDVEHLGAEVDGDVAGDEDRGIDVVLVFALQRHVRQSQPGRPTPGAVGEGLHRGVGELGSARGEQLAGLVGLERQIREPDLADHSLQAVLGQRQSWIHPRHDDQPEPAGRVTDQEVELVADLLASDRLGVVEDQDDGVGTLAEPGGQPHEQGVVDVLGVVRRSHAADVDAAARQTRDHVRPEHPGEVVLLVEADPHHRPWRDARGGPRARQHRLARAGRGADEGDRPGDTGGEQLEEPAALQNGGVDHGEEELRGHDRVADRSQDAVESLHTPVHSPLGGVRPPEGTRQLERRHHPASG